MQIALFDCLMEKSATTRNKFENAPKLQTVTAKTNIQWHHFFRKSVATILLIFIGAFLFLDGTHDVFHQHIENQSVGFCETGCENPKHHAHEIDCIWHQVRSQHQSIDISPQKFDFQAVQFETIICFVESPQYFSFLPKLGRAPPKIS